MMKLVIKTILIVGVCSLSQMLFPWWSVVVSALVVNAMIPTKARDSFLAGFIGVGLLWLAYAGYLHYKGGVLLSAKITELLHLKFPLFLFIITAFIGGMTGGLGALSGYYLRAFFEKSKA